MTNSQFENALERIQEIVFWEDDGRPNYIDGRLPAIKRVLEDCETDAHEFLLTVGRCYGVEYIERNELDLVAMVDSSGLLPDELVFPEEERDALRVA